MKQKVLIKVNMNTDKSRSKALKTVVGLSGVESAALQGKEKDQLEVVGEGVDCVVLTRLLRKYVGYADLISVGPMPAPEKKADPPKAAAVESTPQMPIWGYQYPVISQPYFYEVRETDPGCSIM
ncbi:heavy metal-associated isoprenylated plant protein 16-like [Impatiens glandulifera]|uniref:heavy metal-associated isoprenylated plant protein 16-like n=1 Tax=Impatiens glandulifera TaxID=253017 RepID=UPI001FB13CE6|nr:heavy metal-associated isoprenylated plant protein 16-like [Impatiens glandulifera]